MKKIATIMACLALIVNCLSFMGYARAVENMENRIYAPRVTINPELTRGWDTNIDVLSREINEEDGKDLIYRCDTCGAISYTETEAKEHIYSGMTYEENGSGYTYYFNCMGYTQILVDPPTLVDLPKFVTTQS